MPGERREQRSALAPDQPGANDGDAAIAREVDPVSGVVHLHGGGAEDEPGRADERNRDHRLEQRRHQRHQGAALERRFVGQHVGGEDRLAVTRTGGVHHAIGETEADQSPGGARLAVQRMDLGRDEMGEP